VRPSAPPADRPGGGLRQSLRDQIASLGTSLKDDAGGSAKQTVSLDSREPRFLNYLARLKRRVQNEWEYPEAARQNGVTGELLLIFTLNKAGSLTSIRLVESSGFPVLDQEALRAVKAAAPYDPFPPQMGEEPWNIRATFRYYAPHQYYRN
jgi:protein TonB